MHLGGNLALDALADQGENAHANDVQPALERVGGDGDERQRNQRRDALAAEHPVVNLHHENRAREHEQVDDTAHEADSEERRMAR